MIASTTEITAFRRPPLAVKRRRRKSQWVLWWVALLSIGSAQAQIVDYSAFLNGIADRSPHLDAAEKGHQATHRALRVGLAPDDPEVGFEYYVTGEARYELALEQRFDFLTVYHQRNKISKLGISKAQQELQAQRRGILSEISENYLTLNYASELVDLLTERKTGLQQLVALHEEGVQAGQLTSIDLENARMMLVTLEQNLVIAQARKQEAADNLRLFNGGIPLAPQGYPSFIFSGTRDEFIESALALDYELQAVAIDTLIARRELKLSRQEWIPKLKVGYKLEMEGNKGTNVLLAGISIPLWQNSGKTKYAKALGHAAKAQHAVTEQSVRIRLGTLYDRYRSFSAVVGNRATDPNANEYPNLLRQSLEAGTLTNMEFLLSLDEWYSLMWERTSLRYETALAGAMMAICLM